VSTVFTLPYAFALNYTYSPEDGIFICGEEWLSEYHRKIFGTVTAILQFGVPFIVIIASYSRISKALSAQVRLKQTQMRQRAKASERIRNQRINRMIAAVVSVFALCWLPMTTINLVNDLVVNLGHWYYYELVFFICHWIAMSSTCYNPLLYAWLNDSFKNEFKLVMSSLSRQAVGTTNTRILRSRRTGTLKSVPLDRNNSSHPTTVAPTMKHNGFEDIPLQTLNKSDQCNNVNAVAGESTYCEPNSKNNNLRVNPRSDDGTSTIGEFITFAAKPTTCYATRAMSIDSSVNHYNRLEQIANDDFITNSSTYMTHLSNGSVDFDDDSIVKAVKVQIIVNDSYKEKSRAVFVSGV
jgi:hypothetical protein